MATTDCQVNYYMQFANGFVNIKKENSLIEGILLVLIVFLPMVAAVAGYAIGRKNDHVRDVLMITSIALVIVLCLAAAQWSSGAVLSLTGSSGLSLRFSFDGFRILYGCIAGFLWLVTSLFSPGYFAHAHNRNRYMLFNMLTLSATLGVFFSADLFSAFLFFEVMSLASYAMVVHDESPSAIRAGETYLVIAIFSGLVMLMGMLLLWQRAGTLAFTELYEICAATPDISSFYLPGALLVIGFGAKAGLFPLHVWLPHAHSAAPAPASALLSGILTKTGVFGIVLVSCYIFPGDRGWGSVLLIPAAITMLLGAVLGVFSGNLKRTLACSTISQIGFIIIGVALQCLLGEHNALAVRGVLLHMLNHSLFKLVLFVSAGVVYIGRHDLSLEGIRGYGRGKPLFLFVFLMGALGICGMPFWSGYISKTLLHESIIEGIHMFSGQSLEFPLRLLEGAFILAGGLTVAYMLKLFVVLFVERGEAIPEIQDRYISHPAAVALAISAALIPLLGCFTVIPDSLADWGQRFFNGYAPDHAVHYFAWENLRGALISAVIGVAVYFIFVRWMPARRGKAGIITYADPGLKWFDIENNVYRPLLWGFVKIVVVVARFASSLPDALIQLILRTVLRTSRKTYAPRKFLSRHIWVSERQPQSFGEEPAVAGSFSLGLLFVGVGICVVVIYVFFQAL